MNKTQIRHMFKMVSDEASTLRHRMRHFGYDNITPDEYNDIHAHLEVEKRRLAALHNGKQWPSQRP